MCYSQVMERVRNRWVKISEMRVRGTEFHPRQYQLDEARGRRREVSAPLHRPDICTGVEEMDSRGVEEEEGDAEVVSDGSDGVGAVSGSGDRQVGPHEEQAERADQRSDHQRASSSDPVNDEQAEDHSEDELACRGGGKISASLVKGEGREGTGSP